MGGPRETGGAAQNRVAAGSGSASWLSLAIALVRRVKVGINGRRTLLEYGRGNGDSGRGKGPSRSVAGARHGGAIAAVGVSSWVPKEEKLSWRDAPRASSFAFSLFLFFSSSTFLVEGGMENSFDTRAKRTKGDSREFVPSGRFLVHIYRFVR